MGYVGRVFRPGITRLGVAGVAVASHVRSHSIDVTPAPTLQLPLPWSVSLFAHDLYASTRARLRESLHRRTHTGRISARRGRTQRRGSCVLLHARPPAYARGERQRRIGP